MCAAPIAFDPTISDSVCSTTRARSKMVGRSYFVRALVSGRAACTHNKEKISQAKLTSCESRAVINRLFELFIGEISF